MAHGKKGKGKSKSRPRNRKGAFKKTTHKRRNHGGGKVNFSQLGGIATNALESIGIAAISALGGRAVNAYVQGQGQSATVGAIAGLITAPVVAVAVGAKKDQVEAAIVGSAGMAAVDLVGEALANQSVNQTNQTVQLLMAGSNAPLAITSGAKKGSANEYVNWSDGEGEYYPDAYIGEGDDEFPDSSLKEGDDFPDAGLLGDTYAFDGI